MLDRSAVARQLHEFVCTELLRRPPESISLNDALVSGGYLDSFALAQLGVFIEEAFGVALDDAELARPEFDSLDEMVDLILRSRGGE